MQRNRRVPDLGLHVDARTARWLWLAVASVCEWLMLEMRLVTGGLAKNLGTREGSKWKHLLFFTFSKPTESFRSSYSRFRNRRTCMELEGFRVICGVVDSSNSPCMQCRSLEDCWVLHVHPLKVKVDDSLSPLSFLPKYDIQSLSDTFRFLFCVYWDCAFMHGCGRRLCMKELSESLFWGIYESFNRTSKFLSTSKPCFMFKQAKQVSMKLYTRIFICSVTPKPPCPSTSDKYLTIQDSQQRSFLSFSNRRTEERVVDPVIYKRNYRDGSFESISSPSGFLT